MTNPYWHDEFKPHLTDRGEIRLLCFEIHNIVASSASRQGLGLDPNDDEEDATYPEIDNLCFAISEAELSKRLLRLALLVRTFDDTLRRNDRSEEYLLHRKGIEEEANLGAVLQGPHDLANTIRECSNKIIHAEDVRPVYHTEDDSDHPKARWGMDGTLELCGARGKEDWQITIFVQDYLEAVLELISFGEKQS